MGVLAVGYIVLALMVFFALLWKFDTDKTHQKVSPSGGPYPYAPKSHYYNNQERKFLAALMRAIGHQYLILGKVGIPNVISLEKGLPQRNKLKAYEQICNQQIDFVLCDPRTSRILVAIELFDAAGGERQLKRCAFVDKVFRSANMPLLRFQKREEYLVSDIIAAVERVMGTAEPMIEHRPSLIPAPVI